MAEGLFTSANCFIDTEGEDMKREHINNLGDADIYFVEHGAVNFFDSLMPKDTHTDPDTIFRRHYFDLNHGHLGYFMPCLAKVGPIYSTKHYGTINHSWLNHPQLNRILRDLQND
jgi:hypothetical protein